VDDVAVLGEVGRVRVEEDVEPVARQDAVLLLVRVPDPLHEAHAGDDRPQAGAVQGAVEVGLRRVGDVVAVGGGDVGVHHVDEVDRRRHDVGGGAVLEDLRQLLLDVVHDLVDDRARRVRRLRVARDALDGVRRGVPLRVLLAEVERHVQPGVALERQTRLRGGLLERLEVLVRIGAWQRHRLQLGDVLVGERVEQLVVVEAGVLGAARVGDDPSASAASSAVIGSAVESITSALTFSSSPFSACSTTAFAQARLTTTCGETLESVSVP
jgi:hypothetical protein